MLGKIWANGLVIVLAAVLSLHFVVQAVLYRDAGFAVVWLDHLAVAAIGAVFFAFARARFRTTMSAVPSSGIPDGDEDQGRPRRCLPTFRYLMRGRRSRSGTHPIAIDLLGGGGSAALIEALVGGVIGHCIYTYPTEPVDGI